MSDHPQFGWPEEIVRRKNYSAHKPYWSKLTIWAVLMLWVIGTFAYVLAR